MHHIVQTDPNGNLLLTAAMLGQQQSISGQYVLEFQGEALILRPIKPTPSTQQQTKRVQQWRDWVQKYSQHGLNLPDEALSHDSIYNS